MKVNVSKIAKTVVTKAKENPGTALAIVSLIAPGLFRKIAPIIVAAGKK